MPKEAKDPSAFYHSQQSLRDTQQSFRHQIYLFRKSHDHSRQRSRETKHRTLLQCYYAEQNQADHVHLAVSNRANNTEKKLREKPCVPPSGTVCITLRETLYKKAKGNPVLEHGQFGNIFLLQESCTGKLCRV